MAVTLQGYLRELHDAADQPSARTIANGTGNAVSHAAINDALRGKRASTWRTIELLVRQLGGDTRHAYSLWQTEHFQDAYPGDDPELERHETAVLVLVNSQGVDAHDARNVCLDILARALAGQGTVDGRNITVEVRGRQHTITIEDIRPVHSMLTRPALK